jgi:hypothetical protein
MTGLAKADRQWMNRGLCPLSEVFLERGVAEQSLSRVCSHVGGQVLMESKQIVCGWHAQDRDYNLLGHGFSDSNR